MHNAGELLRCGAFGPPFAFAFGNLCHSSRRTFLVSIPGCFGGYNASGSHWAWPALGAGVTTARQSLWLVPARRTCCPPKLGAPHDKGSRLMLSCCYVSPASPGDLAAAVPATRRAHLHPHPHWGRGCQQRLQSRQHTLERTSGNQKDVGARASESWVWRGPVHVGLHGYTSCTSPARLASASTAVCR